MNGHSTPSQTVGPFFSIGFDWMTRSDLAPGIRKDKIVIRGRILDGDGKPVPDAVLEIWQADANGHYPDPNEEPGPARSDGFVGFGRVATNDDGEFSFTTIKPGPLANPDESRQAPHLQISLFMRGLLLRLVTRMYFPDDPLNSSDFVLGRVPETRRNTLIARRAASGDNALEWNVHLQGDEETVFFDC